MNDEQHVNRSGLFTAVFIALLVLTVISFAVANSSLMDQPVRGWAAMLIVSVAKAALVVLFFMHLRWERTWKYVLTIPAMVMSALLILILVPDIGNRTGTYSPTRQKFAAYELDIDEPLSKAEPVPSDGKDDDESNPPPTDDSKGVEKADSEKDFSDVPGEWGSIRGRFVVQGDVPEPESIIPDRDKEACEVPMNSRSLVVNADGGLKNVVVFLKKPKDALPIHPYYQDRMKTPVVLDNVKCRFEPHVVLLTTSQPLRVKNSDPVGHNANITSFFDQNSSNNAIAAGRFVDTILPKPESRPIPVSCTSHGWMKAHLMVRDEPYMAVSDANGQFEIPYLPAGTWELQFWHENVGYLRSAKSGGEVITVGRRGLVDVTVEKDGTRDLGEIQVTAADLAARQ